MDPAESFASADRAPPPVPGAAQRIRFVLVAPTHPGNVGAAARALHTMGFRRLLLVAPRDPAIHRDPAAVARAANAVEVLAAAEVAADLAVALDGVGLAFAMTGYPREFGPAMRSLDAAAAEARAALQSAATEVAFVFGTERSGLSNADVLRCHAGCAIDADPLSGSLNLAQAVQVTAYECRRAGLAAPAAGATRHFDPDAPATVDATEALFAHLERALCAVGVLDPEAPRMLMPRLRRLILRARPTGVEVELLRGICAAMVEPRGERVGRKRHPRHAGGSTPGPGASPPAPPGPGPEAAPTRARDGGGG